ncbi:HNH endonuclease signature motif containing protein [Saccharopolyspora sp. SCSIO 74807]|uniref:HNH endonuclease n=1 Tax=Saccharopolyspora sp. SCSIO 74807 TaxID=3118084 RepID=UPI0030D0FF9B
MRRDAYTCHIKGPDCVGVATDVDHIRPGDRHELSNLQAACKPCHARKSAREGVQGRARRAALRLRPAERHPGLTGEQ